MSLRRSLFILTAFVLLVTFPSMRIAIFSYTSFALPIQNFLSNQEQYTSEEPSQKTVYVQAKTSLDLLSITDGIEVFPTHPPLVSSLWRNAVEISLQDVVREIFIPPEIPS